MGGGGKGGGDKSGDRDRNYGPPDTPDHLRYQPIGWSIRGIRTLINLLMIRTLLAVLQQLRGQMGEPIGVSNDGRTRPLDKFIVHHPHGRHESDQISIFFGQAVYENEIDPPVAFDISFQPTGHGLLATSVEIGSGAVLEKGGASGKGSGKILCASRNPTSPSRTRRQQNGSKEQVFQEEPKLRDRFSKSSRRFSKSSRRPKLSPEASKIEPKTFQNKAQNLPKSSPNPPKIEPKWRQEGPRTTKKTKKNKDPTRRGVGQEVLAHILRKKCPTWLQVGLENRSKIEEKSMQKSIENLMHLGIERAGFPRGAEAEG